MNHSIWRGLGAALTLLALSACGKPGLDGRWQLSWQGRLGTEHATLQWVQHGTQLQGVLIGARARAPISGSVQGDTVSWAVVQPGPPPFEIAFSGERHGDHLSGQAQPRGLSSRTFAGHGGEVSSAYYSWSAERVLDASSAAPAGTLSRLP